MISTFLLAPRVGHLYQALHVFKYLKDHKRSKCVFNSNYVDITDAHMPVEKREIYRLKFMNELYLDTVEDLLNPKGHDVQISRFVNADHGGYQITQKSRTGILIFLNKAPIMCYWKHHNTVETYTFSSEFLAMNQDMIILKALKCKLWMFGIEMMENETK